MKTLAALIVAALIAFLSVAALAQAQTVPEPDGFRSEPYLAPVPATLAGAQVIDAARAVQMHEQGVPFLDVLPRRSRPENLPEGTIWREKPHYTIPGAAWLFDTGYDRLSDVEKQRLANGLRDATGGDKSAPVVMFCKADCWMSWNAAKRAVAMGYGAVYWFPEGVDGWAANGGDLIVAEPDPQP